jgi:hypothetical protein
MGHCLGRRRKKKKHAGTKNHDALKGYGVQLPTAPLTVKQPSIVVIDFVNRFLSIFLNPTHDNEN